MAPKSENPPNDRGRDILMFACFTGPITVSAGFDPEFKAQRPWLITAGVFVSVVSAARSLRYLEDRPVRIHKSEDKTGPQT